MDLYSFLLSCETKKETTMHERIEGQVWFCALDFRIVKKVETKKPDLTPAFSVAGP